MNSNVSIVIPTFNRSHYLPEAIESCLNQTYKCEIIVCDHGSTDQTPQVMDKYLDKVKYLRREKDFGPHFCWLEGVLHATHEYVHLQFDDDWIEPTFIEECMKLFGNDVGFVFTAASIYEEKEKKVRSVLFANKYSNGINPKWKVERFIVNQLISPGCIVFRKKDLKDALYQGNLPKHKHSYHGVGPDLFMSLICLLRYNKIGFVSKPLAVFRSHEGSITIDSNLDKKKHKEIKKAYAEVRDYYYLLKCAKYLKLIKIFNLSYCWKICMVFISIIRKILNWLKGLSNGKKNITS